MSSSSPASTATESCTLFLLHPRKRKPRRRTHLRLLVKSRKASPPTKLLPHSFVLSGNSKARLEPTPSTQATIALPAHLAYSAGGGVKGRTPSRRRSDVGS